MKLLLTSSGVTNKSIAKSLLELLNKPFKNSHLTFIPTAANIEIGDKTWLVNDMNNFRILGFKSIDIIDIASVPKSIWLSSFENADILVFGGGNTSYLRDWIAKTKLDKYLKEFIKSKVYVGISAGSMVTAKNFSLTYENILYYEKNKSFKKLKGLGYIDFEIRPHLNSSWFPKVNIDYLQKIAKKNPTTFYAIDDNSAIQVVDNKVSVISEGKWRKFN